MKNGRYLINRDDVYVGRLIDTTCVCKESDCETLCPGPYREQRTMLFVINEDKLADDLLYDSANYPILNVTSKNDLLSNQVKTKHGFLVIEKAYNLGKLLEFYGYGETLNMIDIINIRRTIFSRNFAYEHCNDFGFYKLDSDLGYASCDTRNPLFTMFSVLNDLSSSDSTYYINPFMPKLGEGKPRKLTRPKKDNIPTTK